MVSKCRYSQEIADEVINDFTNIQQVVELGCADGNNLIALSPIITNGIGIEPNKHNLKIAKNNIKAYKNITVIAGDHRDLRAYADGTFDLGMTCSVIDHIDPKDLDECIQLLLCKCKNLLLIEPAIANEHRQAREDETTFWANTWYYNYWKMFEDYNCVITPSVSHVRHFKTIANVREQYAKIINIIHTAQVSVKKNTFFLFCGVVD